MASTSESELQNLGLNQLQTSLRVALEAEDYSRAAQIKERLSEVPLPGSRTCFSCVYALCTP